MITVRNKNAIRELLQEEVQLQKIKIVKDLKQDDLTQEIVARARKLNIPVEEHSPGGMPYSRSGKGREVLAATVEPSNYTTLPILLQKLDEHDITPFLLLMNRVQYPNNIGTIARTAYAAGVNGIIYQGLDKEFMNDESVHVSIGALLRIPLVNMAVFPALQTLAKHGIPTSALDMAGEPYYQADLTGPLALILGAEGGGISDTVVSRCDKKIAIPMEPYINSLNVAISAGIILFEKRRQENGS